MELKEAREGQKQLEIKVMQMIHKYEEETGCRVTKAAMEQFTDKRFFVTTVFLGRELKKKPEEG